MRLLIQRVSEASVEVEGRIVGQIDTGLLIFVGIEEADGQEDIDWLCRKAVNLRIFPDADGRMNHSVMDVDGGLLVVSQFTLHASTRKGNRPSYVRAASPDIAIPLYEAFLKKLEAATGRSVASGEFGAEMKVHLLNDGPVTIWIDSKTRE